MAGIDGWNQVRALCCAGNFLLAACASAPAVAEVLPLAEMLRGIQMTQQQCATKPLTIWVNSPKGGFCIRYYLSTSGGDGTMPTVFLQGDQFGRANLKSGRFESVPQQTKDTNTDHLQRMADAFSNKTGGPAIYLARIGVDGSSGHHIVRHSELELRVLNAALDTIKAMRGYTGFHLAGQSGGGTLVGGLLGLRSDIGCAVPGSGRLAALRTGRQPAQTDPGKIWFDPVAFVPAIARSRARILVITDPEDKKVPETNQTAFVEQLRSVGGRAEQFFVQAIDEHRHGTVAYQITAVAGCIKGAPSQAIAQALAEQVRVRVAKAEQIKAENRKTQVVPSSAASSGKTASALYPQQPAYQPPSAPNPPSASAEPIAASPPVTSRPITYRRTVKPSAPTQLMQLPAPPTTAAAPDRV